MAGTTGFEPATSDVTGRRSNQLNYVPATAELNHHITRDFFGYLAAVASAGTVTGSVSDFLIGSM